MQEITVWFKDPEEKIQQILGQSYIPDILENRNTKKSVLVLTEQYLYQKGMVYQMEDNKYLLRNTFYMIPRNTIKGTKTHEIQNLAKSLTTFFISLIVFIVLFVISASFLWQIPIVQDVIRSFPNGFNVTAISKLVVKILTLSGFIIFAYAIFRAIHAQIQKVSGSSQKILLEILFKDESIFVDRLWYSEDELQKFLARL